jgi:hypothetical protein
LGSTDEARIGNPGSGSGPRPVGQAGLGSPAAKNSMSLLVPASFVVPFSRASVPVLAAAHDCMGLARTAAKWKKRGEADEIFPVWLPASEKTVRCARGLVIKTIGDRLAEARRYLDEVGGKEAESPDASHAQTIGRLRRCIFSPRADDISKLGLIQLLTSIGIPVREVPETPAWYFTHVVDDDASPFSRALVKPIADCASDTGVLLSILRDKQKHLSKADCGHIATAKKNVAEGFARAGRTSPLILASQETQARMPIEVARHAAALRGIRNTMLAPPIERLSQIAGKHAGKRVNLDDLVSALRRDLEQQIEHWPEFA